jgi:2-dehydropantoate 2-reductase
VRIAIYGSGGVGGYFGGRLAEVGQDVAFIARGEHLAALRERGLRVDSIAGDFVVAPVQATDDPTTVGPCDVVLVAVKSWQLPDILEGLRTLVGAHTVVVPLLNGVEAPAMLAAALGPAAVAGGTCRIVSRVLAPGHIAHVAAVPEVVVGELMGNPRSRPSRLEPLVAAFVGARVSAREDDEIERVLWEKLVLIAAYGGVGSLSRVSVGRLRSAPGTRRLLEQALHEGEAIARACGIAVADDLVPRSMAYLDALPPDATTSLQRDIVAGRRSELADWNGALVRLAAAAGVDAPLQRVIVDALGSLPR